MQNKRVQLEVLLNHDGIVTTSKEVVTDLLADMVGLCQPFSHLFSVAPAESRATYQIYTL